MKKNKYIIIIFILILIVTGCSKAKINSKKEKYVTCTREIYASDADSNIEIEYVISYDKEGYIKKLKSTEKLTCTNETILNNYEKVYAGINATYKDLKYYKTKVEKKDYTVTNTITINYEKIDMKKLQKIDKNKEQVKAKNGKIKLSDWKKFNKKYGTTCK